MSEELTAEEKQAYEEMQAAPAVEDTPPAEAPEQPAQEPQEAISKPAEGEPEFTSQRAQEKPPEGYVPHQAMHAERAKRQELEKKLAEIEARLAEKEKPADPEPQFVDPLEDPDGFRKYTEHQEKRRQEAIDQFLKQNKAEREREALVQEAGRLEQEFMAKTPDYMDAVQTLHGQRVAELRNNGWNDAEISAQIQADANAIFQAAKQIGMNPAELLYMRARGAGYAPKAPSTPQPDEAAQVTARAEAQKQTQGLGSAGGSQQSGQLTAAQLADMTEAELAKVDPAVIAKAFGA